VEDVVTTGRSTLETASLATSRGARVVAIGSIIDRSAGRDPFDVPFRSLLELDLPSYPPGECPLCKSGAAPAEKPGSRPDAITAEPGAEGPEPAAGAAGGDRGGLEGAV
jgi:orotate phosphoribosyltransferase